MVNISNNQNQRVSVSTNNNNSVSASSPKANDVNAGTNANAQLARSWAIGEGLIQGIDYSSKYYANQSNLYSVSSNTYSVNANVWAEGTDEEVQALGGTHSSKGWVNYVLTNPPTATVEQTETGALLTVHDINGTTTAELLNGVTPIATVSKSGSTATITITDANGTTSAQISDGQDGIDGKDGAAATISVGTVSTGAAGSSASVVNSGTSSAAVFDFTIPKGDKGDTGSTGATGNGVLNTEYISSSGLVDTYHINYTNGTYDSFTVTNGQNGTGSVADVFVNGVSVLDGNVAKVLVPTNNNQLTNGAGYITGITSSDVTTALGYTPLSNAIKYGSSLSYSSNVLQLLDQDGNGLGSSVTIQSSPDIDNKSITTNSDDELQTVSVIDQNNTTNAIKTWTGTKAQYEAIVTKDSNTLYWLTDVKIIYLGDVAVGNFKGGRNVGEIVPLSLPVTDAGLHLLDGSLIPGGGIYQGFVDYIADLYTANPSANYFTTEALWQQSVTTYGVCGKFVYTAASGNDPATVRLPKITGIIEGTTDVNALGDLVEAGLPNITGEFQLTGGSGSNGFQSGAFYLSSTSAGYQHGGDGSNTNPKVGFDASRSSSIYGNSSTVQPQTTKAFYYIVIANSTKTEIQSDIDEIATDLNGKLDTDGSNAPSKLSSALLSRFVPDYTNGISQTLTTSYQSYTCPTDGVVVIGGSISNNASNAALKINGVNVGYGFNNNSGSYNTCVNAEFIVGKGDICQYKTQVTGGTFYFYPMKGAN